MRSAEIRRKFLDYFVARQHRAVESSPLVPADDPTLLFTNAGMVQFKRVFQGLERRDYSRAVTGQKCVRAGGKHNDLEQVGHTARHHTFFEMLGNFSFGDYFKKEAIEYAWEWVTSRDWLGIAPDRLYVSVHHTDDEARRLWRAIALIGNKYDRGEGGASYRVLADHARAVAFLLADGVYPSNEGRGYVLRRILRRAVRHAWLLGRREPTLAQLTRAVSGVMGDVYPELVSKQQHIERITRAEEERFLETIEGGLERMEELRGTGVITGEDAFKLYDTFGFPIDLTQMIASERKQTVDVEGFEQALGHQRRRSRAARKAGTRETGNVQRGGDWVQVKSKGKQKWIGYDATKAETEPIAFRQTGDQLEIILEENPFYAESGGQVSDTGVVKGDGWELIVEDVEKVDGKNAVVGTFGEAFEPTAAVAQVNEARRRNIERNHTATHLVHAALRKVLGTHVRQAGSVVAPDRLRFDFSHHGPIADDALARIEEEVNQHIWENLPVATRQTAYKDAIAAGAMAFFTEKYGDVVRVVDVPGVSLELCGGTHVPTTGQIAVCRFTHETGAAAGVRRIEALTGPAAYRSALDLQQRLSAAAGLLKTQPEHLARRIEAMLEENKKLERRVDELLRGSGKGEGGRVEQIGDVELHISESSLDDRAQIAALMDGFREKHKDAISVLFTIGDKPGIHVAVTNNLIAQGIKAGDIANAIAATAGGKGGGRPQFASAGIGDTARMRDAREQTPRIVRELLKR